MRSYFIAQGTISNILGQNMMENNIKKEWIYIYIYMCVYTHTHIHVYIYIKLSHFAVQQKLAQHCKSTIL